MYKKNETLNPLSEVVAPNGFYKLYERFFNGVFIQDEFKSDPLSEMYIFDRHFYTSPRFYPSKGWEEIKVIDDPDMNEYFEGREKLGELENELLSFLAAPGRRKILKIMGEIGTGKSTFLQYMFEVYLPKQQYFENAIYIPIDMLKVFPEKQAYSYDQAVELIGEYFPRLYREYVISNDEKIPDCPDRWIDIIEFLRERVKRYGNKKVIIAFDNVDVFHSQFQTHLWKLTQNLAESTSATCIISMRKFNARYYEELANIHGTTHFLMEHRSPIIIKVIERRMMYFLYTDSKIRMRRRTRVQLKDLVVEFRDLEEFVRNFVAIIIDDKTSSALENLSNHNIRIALRWTLRFIQAWNLNVVLMVTKLINAIGLKREQKPFTSFHTFINAIGLNNYSTYFPEQSCLENIFSAQLKSSSADLLIKYRILKYCGSSNQPIKKIELTENLNLFGYNNTEILQAVDQLMAHPKRLIQSIDGDNFRVLNTLELCLSGRYYLDRLIFFLDYLQLVKADCYLPDDFVFEQGRDSRIETRMADTISFINFIGTREIQEVKNGLERNREKFKFNYLKVYNNELLSIQLFKRAKNELRHIFNYLKANSRFTGKFPSLVHKVDSHIENISATFNKVYK